MTRELAAMNEQMALSQATASVDLAVLTHRDFAGYLDEEFTLQIDELSIVARLVNVSPWGIADRQRQAFTLTFLGPDVPLLPQNIYAVRHSVLGTMEIFLVPIGPNMGGMQYEAVFA